MQALPFVIPTPVAGQIKITCEQEAENFVCQTKPPATQSGIAQSTDLRYKQVYKRLLARVLKDTGDDSPESIVGWFKSKSPTWSHSTIRQNRAALNHYFLDIETGDNYQSLEMASIALSKVKKHKKIVRRTKIIKQAGLLNFVSMLSISHSKSDKFLADFLIATTLTGLRPCEWKTASYQEISATEINLTVINAKSTNGRALGKSRTINLSGMVSPICKTVDEIQSLLQNENWNKIYERLRRNCYNKRKIYFGSQSNFSPYSGRHQFSANVKNVYGKNAVAMLHGHASNETATTHYGKRVSGWPQFKNLNAQQHRQQDLLVPQEKQVG